MKIATWNINSINARLPLLTKWLTESPVDVLCLQETKCVDENFPYQEMKDLGYHTTFYGQKSYNGVAILSKYEITDVQKNFPGEDGDDFPKRLIAATVNGVRIVNTYIPNGTEIWTDKFTFKLDWLQRLRHYFDETASHEDNVLLCGDFNVAPDELDVWSVPAWTGKLHFSKPERAAIHHVKQWGFVDVFRQMNGDRERVFLVELPRIFVPEKPRPAHRPYLDLARAGRTMHGLLDRPRAPQMGAPERPHAGGGGV